MDKTSEWTDDYRSPNKGDRLLRRSDDWDRGVEFAKEPISRHVHLWDGYMTAAARLVELCSQGRCHYDRNFLIYPILFNYRHGLELAMKWIIVTYGGDGIDGIAGMDHGLWELWKRCCSIAEQHGPVDEEATGIVEQIVKDFHDLDKAGINFRYGWSKDGKEIQLPTERIDLENMRAVMQGVASYFNGLDVWLDELSSAGP
jgi:hypothetical protein